MTKTLLSLLILFLGSVGFTQENFKSEHVSFVNEKDSVKLSGTLALPMDGEGFPAVVMITGSGPQNRYEELFGHKPFLDIANYFTSKGIAVLMYDDRGVGESEGDFQSATTFDLANDAEAAFAFLKARSEVNKEKVGLIGHSEGGIIAPIIASRRSDVGFIGLLAGPGLRGDSLMLLQKRLVETQMGINELQVEFGQKMLRGAYDLFFNENINNTALEDSLSAYFTDSYGALIPESQIETIVEQLSNPWLVEFIRLDPKDYLNSLKCPVFALNGEKDLQVPPKENLEAIRAALSENENVTIKEYKSVNHMFQKCETGAISEYGTIDHAISPKVLKDLSNWILKLD